MLVFRGRHRLLKRLCSSLIFNNNNNYDGVFFPSSQHSAFSSSNNQDAKPNSLVDFLIDSVGFTKQAALIASSKVPSLKSTHSPQLVVNIFKECGLDDTQIKDIITCVPKILNCKPNQTLEPKFRAFREYGFSGCDLVELMKGNPNFLKAGLHTKIIPFIHLIKRLVRSDEELIEAIKKTKWLFLRSGVSQFENMLANVLHMQVLGLSNRQLLYLITAYPHGVALNPLDFEGRLVWIVQELGIPKNSPMFVYAIHTSITSKNSTIQKKIKILRSYKWSEEDIATFVRCYPKYLSFSESKIREGLNFFMKELGFAPVDLVRNNFLLGLSLEKRVKPRYKILEMLKDKKLICSKPSLATLLVYSELNFLQFVKRFQNELPGLFETYTNSIGKTQSEKVMARQVI